MTDVKSFSAETVAPATLSNPLKDETIASFSEPLRRKVEGALSEHGGAIARFGGWMDPAIKSKWIEALRSGRFAQARGQLRKTDALGNPSYCCLGVLCEVADIVMTKDGVNCDPTLNVPPKGGKYDVYDGYAPLLDICPAKSMCVNLNDNYGATFEEIAEFVEKAL